MCDVQRGHVPCGPQRVHPLDTGIPRRPGACVREERDRRGNFLCLEDYIFRLRIIAVAKPILATDSLTGVIDGRAGKAPSHVPQTYWTCI